MWSKASPSSPFFLVCRVSPMHQQFDQSWSQWEHTLNVACRFIPMAGWKSELGPEAFPHPPEGWAFACLLLRTQMSQGDCWSGLLGGKLVVLFVHRFTAHLELEETYKNQVQLLSEWTKWGLNPQLQGYQHHALTYWVFLHMRGFNWGLSLLQEPQLVFQQRVKTWNSSLKK